MRKLVILSIAVATLVACKPSATQQDTSASAVVFKGTLPAADCSGIVYELTLDSDTSFILNMTYLEAKEGRDTSFISNGEVKRASVEAEFPRGAYELLQLKGGDEILNFEILDDTTLCLLNENGELPENQSLYYLHKVK